VITAVKPVYNRKTRQYDLDIRDDVSGPLGTYAQEGYLVYDDPDKTLYDIWDGRLIDNWNDKKREAIIAHLRSRGAGIAT
jgi:hypothetical protein